MKDKIKKQKRKIIPKISVIMLAVFIVVSVVFSALTLNAEKQTQITKSHNDFKYLLEAISSMESPPYNEICKYPDVVKSHQRDIVRQDMEFNPTCGADGTYDNNIQIKLYEYEYETKLDTFIMDTDKEMFFSIMPDEYYSDYSFNSGLINYDEFVSSISEKALSSIRQSLYKKIDKDGYIYLLTCKDGYYNSENGHIYPKTIQLVKAYEDSYGYGIDEVINSYSLQPEIEDTFTYFETGQYEPCIIDGQFVCNDFSSNNLIDTELKSMDATMTDPDTGLVEKDGLFTYKHSEMNSVYIQSLGFDGNKNEILLNEHLNYVYTNNEVDYEYPYKDIIVRYAKRINLLECCGDTLIIGNSIIFLFFLIIAVILIVMMCKMMKTQLAEEEKRSELTNALAHDIKTPLFIISGYAQNLKENINTDKREHYCDRIINKTQEVNELVHKMLELSRIDNLEKAIERENLNIAQMVKEITSSYESLPDKKSFVMSFAENCHIYADKSLIHRAVSNLISNAVMYSDYESEIKIDISDTAFSISNKCSSITQSDLKHLTEPYYRVEKNRNSKGNGLGLSIVKSITDMHNYKLDIKLCDSTITFTLSFS